MRPDDQKFEKLPKYLPPSHTTAHKSKQPDMIEAERGKGKRKTASGKS